MKPQDVTLYIPARNAARTLPAAVDSVLAQTAPPAELLVVVDARSTDATVEIARRAGARVVTQTAGLLGTARNLAIQACRTPWLASCDADVTLEPTWLEALLGAADDTVVAVGGGTRERLLTAADRWRAVNMPHNWGPLPFDNPFMLVSEMMARADGLRAVGGYRPDRSFGDDSDLCRRLREAGYVLRYEPAAVAWHQRGDTVASVLELRWDYSSPRQRSRLESLPGLISKLPINRVYCLQSLSQTLHSEHAECCAVSLLLWFHHARKDLRAALDNWPLLDEAARANCLALLDEALTGCLAGAWRALLPPLRRLLPTPGDAPDDVRPRAPALADTQGFRRYLDAVRAATRELLDALPPELAAALVRSATLLARREGAASTGARIGGSSGAGAAAPFQLPLLDVRPEDERRLAGQALRPAWTWTELERTLAAAIRFSIGQGRVVGCGPHVAGELPPGKKGAADPLSGREKGPGRSSCVALLPHLEASLSPREALRDVLSAADAAVIGYQPPRVFIAAVPILSARDLAAECASAGFCIRHFHTEAGLTRLIVQRARRPARAGAQPVETEEAQGAAAVR